MLIGDFRQAPCGSLKQAAMCQFYSWHWPSQPFFVFWSIIALQWCVSFCCTMTWDQSYVHIYPLPLWPSSRHPYPPMDAITEHRVELPVLRACSESCDGNCWLWDDMPWLTSKDQEAACAIPEMPALLQIQRQEVIARILGFRVALHLLHLG